MSKNEKDREPGELKFLAVDEANVKARKARKNAPKIDLEAI